MQVHNGYKTYKTLMGFMEFLVRRKDIKEPKLWVTVSGISN